MSDQIPTGGMPGGQQPSEEELRAAIGQMRATPVDQLVAEVASALLNAAQVKLGRNDARLLLDLTAVMTEGTRGHVDDDLTNQLDQALDQLRMAQVQGEREVVQAGTQGHVEQNDLPRRPAPLVLEEREEGVADASDEADRDDGAGSSPPPKSSSSSAASRLWVPGR